MSAYEVIADSADREAWLGYRMIPGFPEYGVNRIGQVVSFHGRNPIILRDACNGGVGHRKINLFHERRHFQMLVHRAVLLAWIGPCPDGMECRHLDGDPTNNRLDNLTCGTHRENEADKSEHGRGPQGERHGRARLNESQVREIFCLAFMGATQRSVAEVFGVSQTLVSGIADGRFWPHLGLVAEFAGQETQEQP